MKKLFFFFAAAMMAGSMMAQTALQNYNVSLGENEKWKVPTTNPFEEREEAIATDYANQIKSSALFRAMGGEEVRTNTIKDLMQEVKTGSYYFPNWIFGSIGKKLIQNKRFRDFLADRCIAILKEMCRLYPASTKKAMLRPIDEVLSIIDYMEKHTYKIAERTYVYGDGDTWTDLELLKDGIWLDEYPEEESWAGVGGTEGSLARRVLLDNISLSEMRAYLQAARKAITDEDVSRRPEYVACYTVNDDLKVFQATDRVFCRFRNGKQSHEAEYITVLSDATGTYYKIIGPFRWNLHDGDWHYDAISTLYDSDGNTIYTDIIRNQ